MQPFKVLIYIIFIALESFVVSFLMEYYKKFIRKDKATKWENRVLGIIMTILSILFLKGCGMFYPLLNSLFNAKLWLDYLIHIVVFYVVQLKTDMLFMKKAVRMLITQWLKNNAQLTEEQSKVLMQALGLEEK